MVCIWLVQDIFTAVRLFCPTLKTEVYCSVSHILVEKLCLHDYSALHYRPSRSALVCQTFFNHLDHQGSFLVGVVDITIHRIP